MAICFHVKMLIMTPREHFGKISTSNELGILDEKNLYQVANSIGANGHQEFRHRQEMLMRNQMMLMNPHGQILGPGQPKMQTLGVHFEPRLLDRNILASSEILSSPETRQIHLGSQLGTSVQTSVIHNRTYPGAGFNILPPETMDSMLRRQELIHKQNLVRLEVDALLNQTELENTHRKGPLGVEVPFVCPGISTDEIAFHNSYRLPKGQQTNDAILHQNALASINVDNSLLMTSNPHPPVNTLYRDRNRRGIKRAASQKNADDNHSGSKGHIEDKKLDCISVTAVDGKEIECENEPKSGLSAKPNQNKADTNLLCPFGLNSDYKESEQRLRKPGSSNEKFSEADNGNTSYTGTEKNMFKGCASFPKYMFPPSLPLPAIPYRFQIPGSTLMTSAGPHAVFLPEEKEIIQKWTVDDVYKFVSLLPGCSDYAQTFKDHAIDGETLPLLTEGHLLNTMGLKLGPALKIQYQVSRHVGNALYVMNSAPSASLQSTFSETVNQTSDVISPITPAGGDDPLRSPGGQDQENFKPSEQSTVEKRDKTHDEQCHLQTSETV
ncbi:sterile alpha motif domain-containing protein 7 isoform X3 [Stegostoma tigrinum]|uniref:sterile alpha motif domain-containing protein 7 isoform X3 n=1 Tax=Stegostoma tigrinum TaxID=3053191 RepID=UPI00202B8C20|nr:sterile alpha motif domain-containing protein 7 isoform X3 [Stegostoma tigrinum]